MAAEPKVQARPRRWSTPVALVLLEEESSHGYELMERIEEEFGFEGVNPGSVHRTLRRMEHEGLCTSEWETPSAEGGPARRVYAITEAEEAYLEAWAEACKRSTGSSWTSSPESTEAGHTALFRLADEASLG